MRTRCVCFDDRSDVSIALSSSVSHTALTGMGRLGVRDGSVCLPRCVFIAMEWDGKQQSNYNGHRCAFWFPGPPVGVGRRWCLVHGSVCCVINMKFCSLFGAFRHREWRGTAKHNKDQSLMVNMNFLTWCIIWCFGLFSDVFDTCLVYECLFF